MARDESERVEFRCDECGAGLTWDPGGAALRCEHCGTRREVPRSDETITERDLAQAGDAERGLGLELRVARCKNCGARVTYEGATTSELCVYCGEAVVLAQEANRNAIRPESLIPLDVGRGRVAERFRAWTHRLWLRPSALRKAELVDAVGVYVPFWTFDAEVESEWSATAGRSRGGGAMRLGRPATLRARTVRDVRWSPAAGKREDRVDDLLVNGSKGLRDDLVARLGGFGTHELVPYRPDYLAGWRAEEYQVDLAEAWERGKRRIEEHQRHRCAADVPGDTHRDLFVRTAIRDVRWKHVLVPLWSVQYRFRGRVYTVLVNGQSGLVVGDAPYSPVKVALLAGALVLAAAALVAVSL